MRVCIHSSINSYIYHSPIHPSINSIHSSIYEFIHPFISSIDFSNAKDAEHYKKINDFLATSIHSNPCMYDDDDEDFDEDDDDNDAAAADDDDYDDICVCIFIHIYYFSSILSQCWYRK